ncbi:hypothetical protein SRB5_35960 [Streptomyces sp. RB5]|uniref:DUF192 domain-containing protein n=1 Tax=Streptomyces smaragdinus TaxID=2585196 RepID=A0A7K0CJ09_9ACTN|nr:DUF192 domain-containing protein [Streptomyces smaragdinus]MQY13448.1 hypothetical protein [Streptomyces smaragdinus]
MPTWPEGPAVLRTEHGDRLELRIATAFRTRSRGLLGLDAPPPGALLLTPASGIHTFGMRFPLDVAYLSRDLRVLAVHTVAPNRLGRPRLRARHVLEAGAGTFAPLGLVRGVRVAVEL